MKKISKEEAVLSSKFWKIIFKLYNLPPKFVGTAIEIASRCDFELRDGFFYKYVLPVLLEEKIMVLDEAEKDKRGYLGRFANVYRFDRDRLNEFVVKNHWVAHKLYIIWIQEGDVDLNIV